MCPLQVCVRWSEWGLLAIKWKVSGKRGEGGGGGFQRSEVKGQEIKARQCRERQLLHQLMTSGVKKTVLRDALGDNRDRI